MLIGDCGDDHHVQLSPHGAISTNCDLIGFHWKWLLVSMNEAMAAKSTSSLAISWLSFQDWMIPSWCLDNTTIRIIAAFWGECGPVLDEEGDGIDGKKSEMSSAHLCLSKNDSHTRLPPLPCTLFIIIKLHCPMPSWVWDCEPWKGLLVVKW